MSGADDLCEKLEETIEKIVLEILLVVKEYYPAIDIKDEKAIERMKMICSVELIRLCENIDE